MASQRIRVLKKRKRTTEWLQPTVGEPCDSLSSSEELMIKRRQKNSQRYKSKQDAVNRVFNKVKDALPALLLPYSHYNWRNHCKDVILEKQTVYLCNYDAYASQLMKKEKRPDWQDADTVYIDTNKDLVEYRWYKNSSRIQCIPSIDGNRTVAISAPLAEKLMDYASLYARNAPVDMNPEALAKLKDQALGHLCHISNSGYSPIYVLDYDAIFVFLDFLPAVLIQFVHEYLYARSPGPHLQEMQFESKPKPFLCSEWTKVPRKERWTDLF